MIIYEKNNINGVCAVGGKGAGLIKLLSYGLNVPDFFVVAAGTDVYAENFAAELDGLAEKLNCGSFAVRSSSINEDGAVLSGRIACMGEARGRVKIVNNLSDAESFEEGCILVTSMTVPEITFALDKACGIITDEGGITCHAAIIAREYAVPCLVGTKCATSVLKDGTKVKLDCINGKVIIDDEECADEKQG